MVDLPKWVSNSFTSALEKYLNNENVRIVEYSSSAAIPVGSNYTTDIFRTVITYTNGKKEKNEKNILSVIIKVCPDDELLINYDKQMRLFEQEITFYTEVLPHMHRILGGQTILAARCLSFIKEPRSAILLEDLTTEGFKMHPRQHGLDLDHCLFTVQTLAHFHATSAMLHEKNPSLINRYNLGIFWNNPFTLRWIATGIDALAKACAKWPGYEKYSKKLESSKSREMEKTLAAVRLDQQDFSVLNHGDFWINNFMFSYSSDGAIKDCQIVDFQVVLHSSPAIDLNYFWATSPNMEVRNKHLNTVIKHYYSCLIATLHKLQYPSEKMPNFKQFDRDFKQRAFYGLTCSLTVLPFVTASNRNDASFEDLFNNDSEDGFRYDSYNNERYRRYMEYLLPYYDNLGIFDL